MTHQDQAKENFFHNGQYCAGRWRNETKVPWLKEYVGNTISEKVWNVLNTRPSCGCGAKTAFINFKEGYREFCSIGCIHKASETTRQKSNRHLKSWSDPEWAAKTRYKMQQAHHKLNTERKLAVLKEKGITPIDFKFDTTSTEYQWEHRCGQVFQRKFQRPHGIWCPVCHVSKGQGELYELIRKNYSGKIVANDRVAISPREIDIYLPDLNLGFEFNGKYWHQGDGFREASKVFEADEEGIKLINVWEIEWLKNRKKIEAEVLALLL